MNDITSLLSSHTREICPNQFSHVTEQFLFFLMVKSRQIIIVTDGYLQKINDMQQSCNGYYQLHDILFSTKGKCGLQSASMNMLLKIP
jgi:hypothetical protein